MNNETLLHRQIHPSWVQNDSISSQAFLNEQVIASLSFTPSAKDDNKLSVYNGEKYTAEESYIHFTESFESAGVLSVSCEEITSVEDLVAYEDNDPFDGHSVIDYSSVESSTQVKKKAKKIKNLAVARGWTHKK
ncbi:hypothetical protein BN1195_03252 [Chryseobacterium oranimense G311]|uniref:hypothetical protein n=1 Tax=Chryseobacterium oranimense TaxID=421058 RepID=UPI000533ABF0|nr:hypothetical protein [Chryseobacterium oranimense]CEJ70913.1 hypothetical protein BN1195_03252 [Chryseobacterium oranimense G311]